MAKEEINQANQLTAKKSNFYEWYNQIIQVAGLIDKRYNVRGCYVWLGYGYKAMTLIKQRWDKLFQENEIQECYFPLLVPVEYAKQNESWFNGFKEEVFWVKSYNEKEARLILRPTGEPAIYPMFSQWVRTKNDLPIRIYETVSSFRSETKQNRPIIRDREITVWHEIHTAHATLEESEKEAELHIKLYDQLWKDIALEPLRVNKPKWECFPGAVGAIEYYSIMPNGKAMENGSVNKLGQAYAKKFDIKFKKEDGREDYAWQVCTGNGARLLAAALSVHGDDRGLVMPPNIAPIQVVIIPILKKNEEDAVNKKAKEIHKRLLESGIRVNLDNRAESVGRRFYEWEIKGVPLRIEIGPNEVKNKSLVISNRFNYKKTEIKETAIEKEIKTNLDEIQQQMYENCKKLNKQFIIDAQDIQKLKSLLKEGKTCKVHWCGSEKCWDKIKGIEEGVELFGTDLKQSKGKCIVCNTESKEIGYVSNTY